MAGLENHLLPSSSRNLIRSATMLAALADASHSFDMLFTQGDTSLLIPAATTPNSVPEPTTALLTGMGATGCAIATRRRDRNRK